jgi:Peptidase S46
MSAFKSFVKFAAIAACAAFLSAAASAARPADEGMWTFDNMPLKLLQEKYGFKPTQEWLDHVRLSSVRFNDGGSGSFISVDGLVMTNHHVGLGQLQKLSTAERDYVATGFYAPTRADEPKCPDLELNVLISSENVTEKVMAAVKEGQTAEQALKAREAAIALLEAESQKQTGLRSNVVSLYHGGEYWLYRYKKYTDVRMVFAPERQVAYWGGDWDNFTYPRYDLDVAIFRVYENGQPAKTEHFFKWNTAGAHDDELVFVSGHPGSTDRLFTVAELKYERDFRYPMLLDYFAKRIAILSQYALRGTEEQRRALVSIFGLENGKKAMTGEYQNGLLDEDMMKKKELEEKQFRDRVAADPKWAADYGDAWDVIAGVMKEQEKVYKQQFYRQLMGSRLGAFATTIVFYVKEVPKPDADRLNGYHDAQLETVRYNLFSTAPIYPDLEEANLAGTLQISLDQLGPDDPFLKIVLGGRPTSLVARELITGTKLADVAYRQQLVKGGEKAVLSSKDPLVVLARNLEPFIRDTIKWNKDNIQSVLVPAQEKIGLARFAVYGKSLYPDATFTLRLSFGAVSGYPMNGTQAPYKTTLYGLYDRCLGFDKSNEWVLPGRFWERQKTLDLSTPVNFVSSCDIIGGNSGSPVINRDAAIVGLIFDGNIESLAGRFFYDAGVNRAVAVHPAYIIEALRKLYDAGALADEIEGK